MRRSEFINQDMARKIFKAFDHSKTIGKPLNQFVVLHLEDKLSQAAYTAFKNIRKKYTIWLAYKSKIRKSEGKAPYEPMYVFTLENPNKNPHVNWVLYIPNELQEEFKRKLPLWVGKVQGELEIHTLWRDDLESRGYKSTANYIVKGIDPEYIDQFFLRELYDKYGPQGVIYGQRAGTSRSLGRIRIQRYYEEMEYSEAA